VYGLFVKLTHFSGHAVRLSELREFAPERNLKRIRRRNDGCRNAFGMLSEPRPLVIRRATDSFPNLSRFPTQPFLAQEL
jgi:hypothetical protein